MLFIRLKIILLCLFFITFAASKDDIRLNQIGFYTYGPKIAVIVSPNAWYFSIKSVDLKKTFFTGELTPLKYWSSSGDSVKIADFSQFNIEGEYVLYISGTGASHKFVISNNNNYELSKALVRHFYFKRASTALSSKYAGKWARAAGHLDNKVMIHSSAASKSRKEGQVFSSPKGWYDAGDYGKYIVNAGISTYQLMLLYEQFFDYFDSLNLNIPESENKIPDLLDEIKWEMDWVLTMQDPGDGGVYHKLTGKIFIGDLVPCDADEERYFIGKSVTASFDFAAICAVAYRLYKKFNQEFADSCLKAAKLAYQWGLENPKAYFKDNPPDIVTGKYEDYDARDECQWASYELFIATNDSDYCDTSRVKKNNFGVPGWQNVGTLGYYSMALVKKDSLAISKVLSIADVLINKINKSPILISTSIFDWGSNSLAANEGMAMLVAFLVSRDYKYLEGAIHSLDYLLGKNGTGYCFVTGFGVRSPMNPHYRPSTTDGVIEPVPGFLVGGPNGRAVTSECSGAQYSKYPAKAWVDLSCSYSTNEVAINWNAPIAFLTGGIEALFNSSKYDLRSLINKYRKDSDPPEPVKINLYDIKADTIKFGWKTAEKTSATVIYSTESSFINSKKNICLFSDTNYTNLCGLLPDTRYYIKTVFVDRNGNISSQDTTFKTSECSLFNSSLLIHSTGSYDPGKDLSIKFKNISDIDTRIIYSCGGSTDYKILACEENDGTYRVKIPGKEITENGMLYRLYLKKGNEQFTTQQFSIAMDSIVLSKDTISISNAYSLVSFPSDFKPVSSIDVLEPFFGDTSSWRFYGYDPLEKKYGIFDVLQSGKGGWLYCKENKKVVFKGKNLRPDSLFPVKLNVGWNCIGNPFSFPVYWNNSIVSYRDVLISITDTLSELFVRQQIFMYRDKSSNNKNDGKYTTNRELISHLFNDSIKIEPWKAFWVYAERDSVTLYLNPKPNLDFSGFLQKRRNHKDNSSWYFTFNAQTSESDDQQVLFGTAQDAIDGYDKFDSPKPPSVSDIQIGFQHPEWNKYDGMYSSDIISNSGNHKWILNVKTTDNKPVTFSWVKNGAYKGMVYLADTKSLVETDLSFSEKYTFVPDKNEKNRMFYINWIPQAKILNRSLPENWSLYAEKNGLGRSLIKLRYSIPVSNSGAGIYTSISVIDINGRCIRKLIDEAKLPGFYTVCWDGRNSSGNRVVSGMYLVRMNNTVYNQCVKIKIVN